jgi:plasmid stabilization system protein ParE
MRGLTEEPHRGRAGRWPNTRELVVRPYVIPYRVKGETVEILRVFHSAREWPDRPAA